MIFEFLIIISAAAIFVILARRLPETDDTIPDLQPIKEIKESQANKKVSFASRLSRFKPKLPKISLRKPTLKSKVNGPVGLGELEAEANSFLESGDLKSAEKLYIKIATKNPKHSKVYNRLGVIYLQQKNFADARDAFLAALKVDDRVASRHYNLGLAYMGLNVNEKAKVSIKRAIDLDPGKNKYRETLKTLEKSY